jgi:hypothetical protein
MSHPRSLNHPVGVNQGIFRICNLTRSGGRELSIDRVLIDTQ